MVPLQVHFHRLFFRAELQFKRKITTDVERRLSFEKCAYTNGRKFNLKVIVEITLFGKYQK